MSRQPVKQPPWWIAAILLSVFLTLAFLSVWTLTAVADSIVADAGVADAVVADAAAIYQTRTPHRDGIGKIYQGREIAQVMGHTGATWLERPSRSWEEQPQKLIDALDLQPIDRVADIGAGTGYFSFRIAPLVPQGKVFAVDIQPEMIDILNFLKEEDHVENVEPILATLTDPQLPEGIDRVLMVDAYHEFEYPYEVMTAIVRSLSPHGQVILAEYRGENPFIPIKGLHKMTQRQVRREMAAIGLRWVKTFDGLPQQHLMVFEKSEA